MMLLLPVSWCWIAFNIRIYLSVSVAFFHPPNVDSYRFDRYTFITFNFRTVRLFFSRARTRSLQIKLSIDEIVSQQRRKKPSIDTGKFEIAVCQCPHSIFSHKSAIFFHHFNATFDWIKYIWVGYFIAFFPFAVEIV